jgi:hypothetical protein
MVQSLIKWKKKAPAKDAFFSKSRIELPDQQGLSLMLIVGTPPETASR